MKSGLMKFEEGAFGGVRQVVVQFVEGLVGSLRRSGQGLVVLGPPQVLAIMFVMVFFTGLNGLLPLLAILVGVSLLMQVTPRFGLRHAFEDVFARPASRLPRWMQRSLAAWVLAWPEATVWLRTYTLLQQPRISVEAAASLLVVLLEDCSDRWLQVDVVGAAAAVHGTAVWQHLTMEHLLVPSPWPADPAERWTGEHPFDTDVVRLICGREVAQVFDLLAVEAGPDQPLLEVLHAAELALQAPAASGSRS